MSDEITEQELADTIYSKCGINIRYCDSQTIAIKLLELYHVADKIEDLLGESRKEIKDGTE